MCSQRLGLKGLLPERTSGLQGLVGHDPTVTETVGLISSPRSGGRDARSDTPACWRALLSVADQLGDPPRCRRYLKLSQGREDIPSILRRRLGLWPQIVAALDTHASGAVGDLELLAA